MGILLARMTDRTGVENDTSIGRAGPETEKEPCVGKTTTGGWEFSCGTAAVLTLQIIAMYVHSSRRFDLRQCMPMSRPEEQACALEYARTRDPALAKRLILANMRLVATIAHELRRAHTDLSDLIQEGNRGLVRALEMYDPSRGIRLSSYAAWWIRSYMLKFTIDNWQLVRVGTTQAQRRLFFNLRKERRNLEKTGAVADPKQLASVLGVKEKEIVAMLERFAGGETSLDAPRRSVDHAALTLGELLPAEPGSRPDLRVEDAEFARVLRDKLRFFGEGLEGRDAAIFRRRLLSEQPLTLAQLATEFGVTRERARQVELRLKGRLRDYLRREMGGAVEPQDGATDRRGDDAFASLAA
jgi:RNA polymerase sigma-32 factor